jgi:hypothetical protein
MQLRAASLGFLLFAAQAAGAEDSGAPLAGTSRELKELGRDQAAKQGEAGTTSLLTGVDLKIQSPAANSVPFDFSKQQKQDMARPSKKPVAKNWLVDGVNQLEKADKGERRENAGLPDEAGEQEAPDSSDPDYILKLYNDQKKETDAKAEARQMAAGKGDPIAPFLQGWLASTPAQGKLADDFSRSRGGDSQTPSGGPIAGASGQGYTQDYASPALAPARGASSGSVTPVNPYLSGLELSSGLNQGSSPIQGMSGPGLTARPAELPAVARTSDLPPAIRLEDRRAPLAAPVDDKKYLPQLKRF